MTYILKFNSENKTHEGYILGPLIEVEIFYFEIELINHNISLKFCFNIFILFELIINFFSI